MSIEYMVNGKTDNFTPGMKITNQEWMDYHLRQSKRSSSKIEEDCLCGPYGNCLAHHTETEDEYYIQKEPNQQKQIYQEPKYPDEPLYLGWIFFGFVIIVVVFTIIYNLIN